MAQTSCLVPLTGSDYSNDEWMAIKYSQICDFSPVTVIEVSDWELDNLLTTNSLQQLTDVVQALCEQ